MVSTKSRLVYLPASTKRGFFRPPPRRKETGRQQSFLPIECDLLAMAWADIDSSQGRGDRLSKLTVGFEYQQL